MLGFKQAFMPSEESKILDFFKLHVFFVRFVSLCFSFILNSTVKLMQSIYSCFITFHMYENLVSHFVMLKKRNVLL